MTFSGYWSHPPSRACDPGFCLIVDFLCNFLTLSGEVLYLCVGDKCWIKPICGVKYMKQEDTTIGLFDLLWVNGVNTRRGSAVFSAPPKLQRGFFFNIKRSVTSTVSVEDAHKAHRYQDSKDSTDQIEMQFWLSSRPLIKRICQLFVWLKCSSKIYIQSRRVHFIGEYQSIAKT